MSTLVPLSRMPRFAWGVVFAVVLAAVAAPAVAAPARISDLTRRPGETPQRLVGYGLVVGLDGTGDRGSGGPNGQTPSVRSIVNLLRRFDVEVPGDRLRPRNVAAVLVTAEVSPWLGRGGRFEVQVSAIGDATSLRGGVLWMTPLAAGPDLPVVASAQGPLMVSGDDGRSWSRRSNSGRIPEGGVLDGDLPPPSAPDSSLVLREPDLVTAQRVASAVNAAFGAGSARVRDPGAVSLSPAAAKFEGTLEFLAAVDTLTAGAAEPARVVIDRRDGSVVAGGGVRVGAATVSVRGLTLVVGGAPLRAASEGLVRVESSSAVSDVAAGLHAAGARADDLVAIFEALRAAGALHAQLVVR